MQLKLFLGGDTMLGRGIDQILAHPSKPQLKEDYINDARCYISLAENISGKIHFPVSSTYIWGDALSIIDRFQPDLRVVNLETTITKSDNFWPKGINYRMHPGNIDVLQNLGINAAILANNHAFDFKEEGLQETLEVLSSRGIQPVGAGLNILQAEAAAKFTFNQNHFLILAYAHPSSGVVKGWGATLNKPGINILSDLSVKEITAIKNKISADKKNSSIGSTNNFLVMISIHWGANWGYEISRAFRKFAHALIDEAGVDLVFGHSSHHFQGLEVYQDKLIMYGAGDLINDYEGISGYEQFRSDLSLIYLLALDWETKKLDSLTAVPFQIRKFRLNYPTVSDFKWVFEVLQRESRIAGKRFKIDLPNRMIILD